MGQIMRTPRNAAEHQKLIEIGIPAFNEERNLGHVLEEILSVIKPLKKRYRVKIVVVDDASTDRTAMIAKSYGAIVLSHPKNMGYGASIRTFLNYAIRSGADAVILMDADGQHPPEELPRVLAPVLHDEADVVIGSRFLKGSPDWIPIIKKAGMRFYSLLVSFLTRRRITDVTSGFRAMNRKALLVVTPIYPNDYPAVKVTAYLGLRGLRMVEVPVNMRPRRSGRSYIRGYVLLRYHLRVIKHLLKALIGR